MIQLSKKISFLKAIMLFVFVIISSSAGFAQSKLDSLEKQLPSTKGNERALILNQIAREYMHLDQASECIRFANQALNQAKKIKNAEEQVKALNTIAIQHSKLNEPSKALNFALEARKIAASGKIKIEEANALNLLGILHDQKGEYNKALDYHMEALEIRRSIDDKDGISKSLNNIGQIYVSRTDYNKAIEYYNEALELKISIGDVFGIAMMNYNIGNIYLHRGINEKAIEYHHNALKAFEQINHLPGIAQSLNVSAMIYENMNNSEKALEYYNKALDIVEELGDVYLMSMVFSNMGNVYVKLDNYDEALRKHNKALELRKDINDRAGIAISLNNIGLVYSRWKKPQEGLRYYLDALEINKELGIKKEIANNLVAIGSAYNDLGEHHKALDYLNQSVLLGYEWDLLSAVRDAFSFLSQTYKNMGNYVKSLEYFERHVKLKDSISSQESFNKIAELQTLYETEKKEQEIKLLNIDKDLQAAQLARQKLVIFFFIIGLVLVIGLVFVIFQSLQRRKRDNKIIAAEKSKVEDLLLNTLPIKVVNDLKVQGYTEPESFDNVSVYFSDIAGFTNISSNLEPKVLIAELNDLFTAFDDIIYKHHCERIKTIGDAYMAVCGMPQEDENHAENMVLAALEILDFLKTRNKTSEIQWNIRIGIHSGRVVGGIVGVRKYIYDVFGDTINTAARMETNSETMRINVSHVTYDLLKDKFNFSERPVVEVKGKGSLKMYFVEGPKQLQIQNT